MRMQSCGMMKPRVALYGCDTLLEMRLASLLNVTVAEGLQLPDRGEDQGGGGRVKEPCSTSSTLLSYIFVPLFHFVLPVAKTAAVDLLLEGA